MRDQVAELMELVKVIEPLARRFGWDIMLIGEGDRPTGLLVAECSVVQRSLKDHAIRFDLAEAMKYRGQG